MDLKERIQSDSISAMKNREDFKKLALSSIKAKITELEKMDGKSATDNDIIKVISTLIKQREQSIEAFGKGNRFDLVKKEKEELEIIKSYLPSQLTDEDIISILKPFYMENSSNIKNENMKVGIGMGHMNKMYTGQFDSKSLKDLINRSINDGVI